MKATAIFFFFLMLLFGPSVIYGQKLSASKHKVVICAIKGTTSKPDTIELNSANGSIIIDDFSIMGAEANFFSVISVKPTQVQAGKPEKIIVNFHPDVNFIGIARATLQVKGTDL